MSTVIALRTTLPHYPQQPQHETIPEGFRDTAKSVVQLHVWALDVLAMIRKEAIL